MTSKGKPAQPQLSAHSTPPTKPETPAPRITTHPSGTRVEVRVKPRACRTAIVAVVDGTLIVALAAPPVDGHANQELIRSLAKWLKVPPSTVTIHGGDKSRNKLLNFATLTAHDLAARLLPLCPTSAEP